MSAELPDFQSAPMWLDALGGVVTQKQVMDYRGPLSDFSTGAPWMPLDTTEGHVKRIDRDKLAGVIQSVLDRWFDGYSGGHGVIADAVLAALPELMGGEQR